MAVRVGGLAVGDGEQPAAQVGVHDAWIGAQGREEGLLVSVVSLDASEETDQEVVYVGAVVVEQGLEGGQGHVRTTVQRWEM